MRSLRRRRQRERSPALTPPAKIGRFPIDPPPAARRNAVGDVRAPARVFRKPAAREIRPSRGEVEAMRAIGERQLNHVEVSSLEPRWMMDAAGDEAHFTPGPSVGALSITAPITAPLTINV